MFRFLELSLHGWDLWPPVRVPLDRDVVLVTGPNGAGKTALLDAIRQLLNAPRLSSRRRLQSYLRRPDAPALIRAVVSNRASDSANAPFRRERITTPEATLACGLVPASGGAPEKRFAVLPGRPSIEEIRQVLLDSHEWYDAERYQRVLESAGVTRSLMSVLALEQGRTNALFELKPRELFRRVLEMMGDHAVLERYAEARRRFAESKAGEELADCRHRYLEVVSGALSDYRRRILGLAAGAEVRVEMDLPRLSEDDRVLDEAAIEVRFGFDGKEPLPLGDPSFSGGQQAVAGLLLLMAMAETEGPGFFLLDEPFAHLSLDRVGQVGRILRASRSQFILTAPTTLDRAQLDPASLVIVLQKKRPDEPHAPVPIVAEA